MATPVETPLFTPEEQAWVEANPERCGRCGHLYIFHNFHCCTFCTVDDCECGH